MSSSSSLSATTDSPDTKRPQPETTGLVLYTSSVAGSVAIDKATDRTRFLLQAHKAPYTEVDVSISVVDKEYLHAHSKAEKGKVSLPQLFLNGEYLASKDEIEEANEYGEIKELLQLNK